MQETGGTPPGQRSRNQEQDSTYCTSRELCSWTTDQAGMLLFFFFFFKFIFKFLNFLNLF